MILLFITTLLIDKIMSSFVLKGGLGIGQEYPVRVNLNYGINSHELKCEELSKLRKIFLNNDLRPDICMDLSTVKLDNPLYSIIRSEYNIPVGIVPVYTCFKEGKGIDVKDFFENLLFHISNGISFFTLHLTPDYELLELSKKNRKIPLTSRGGGIVLSDMLLNNRVENILIENIDEIIEICKDNNVAISLGTSFRPASIFEACDEVHIAETFKQLKLCKYIKDRGVNVLVENIGHITLDKIKDHSNLLKQFEAPIMPLGPLPTDIGFDNDHIASSIGATTLAMYDCLHIINCITPCEHTSSIIDQDSMVKGIKAAKLTSHIINTSRGYALNLEKEKIVYKNRSERRSCFNEGEDCKRCSFMCPLKIEMI